MAKLPNCYKIHTDGHDVALEPIYEELVPVVHGRWRFFQNYNLSWYAGVPSWGCTICGFSFEDRNKDIKYPAHMKYCPNCGAKMDGDE